MYEESIRQEFRLKNRDETRNHLIEEIDQNELMCKRHRNVCRVLNYIDRLLILVSKIAGCISTSDLTSLVGIPLRITSSAIVLKICVTTAVQKKKARTFDLLKKQFDRYCWWYIYKSCLFDKNK